VIVTCEECSTQFQLDDSKVPSRGIRVRCSRCKHAFLVQPPGLSPSDRIQQAAEDALSGDSSLGPGTTQDLPPRPEADDGGPEADWEFNHDFGSGEKGEEGGPDRRVAAREAIDDLLRPNSGGSRVSELAADSVPDLRADSTPNLREETAFDPDSSVEIESPPPLETEDESAFEAPPARTRAPVTPVEGADEAGARSRPPTASVALGSIFSTPAGLTDGDGAAARAAAASLDVDAESPMAIRLGRIASAAGWVATIGLIGAVVYGSFVPRVAQSTAAGPAQVLDRVEAESVEGRWIENAVAGRIFVVSGTLRTTGRGPVAAPLQVQILDRGGAALDVTPAPVGPALALRALREQDPAILTAAHGRASRWLAQAPIAGGERRRFQAVFMDLPPAAAAFRLAEAPRTSASRTP
jgi:predicted Zn finger-like uncharacterized protein